MLTLNPYNKNGLSFNCTSSPKLRTGLLKNSFFVSFFKFVHSIDIMQPSKSNVKMLRLFKAYV
jgi:hypothetical protein